MGSALNPTARLPPSPMTSAIVLWPACSTGSNMGMWWGEGHAGREAAGLEPRDNLSKLVESKKKKLD